MIYELTMQAGVNFSEDALTVEKLYDGLTALYGKDTADVIIGDVLQKIGKVSAEQMDRK